MSSKIISAVMGAIAVLGSPSAAQADTWTEVAELTGLGRHHPVTFTLDGYGYVATGSTSGAASTDDFYRYDPVADSWTTLPDFPGPDRGYSYGGAHGGKGYLGFGRAAGYFSDLWEYDPVTEMWTELASCPGQPRSHPAFIITDDGKIYVGCGSSAIGNLGDWWEYDIAGDSWVQHDDLPGPVRHHPYYFNIGNVPYVGFGHGAEIYRDFYRFNPDSKSWTQMNDFPGEGRVAGTQFSHGGKGYILSGEGVDHQQFATGEFWEYDAASDLWTALVPHPGSGRWAPGTFLIDDSVYFLAGLSTTLLERDMFKADMGSVVSVDAPSPSRPSTIAMQAPQPNPFQSETVIPFELDAAGQLAIDVFDATGRRVRSVASGRYAEGAHVMSWDGRSDAGRVVSPGVYFVRVTMSSGSAARRVTLLP